MKPANCHPECTHEGSRSRSNADFLIEFLRGVPLRMTVLFVLTATSIIRAAETPGIKVDWLDHIAPTVPTGVSFGVPWPRGGIQKGESLHLVNTKGESIPVQTWPLAYWPDGSLKWTGHAIAADAGMNGPFTVEPGEVALPETPIRVDETKEWINIDTGKFKCS